jgi:succinyl-CoA synthetase alpha subunit
VSGITGREGTFHALNNKRYGTNVVSGVTPGKAGQQVDGIPVFDSFRQAVEETDANAAMVFVPARFAADSILEAAEAGIRTIIAITEGIPAHDELRVSTHLGRLGDVRLIGPNCPGVLSPGKANVGIIPADFFKEGNVGVVSRSGTLTYQIGNELAQRGFGNSTIVGIGGDPIVGSDFIDILTLFEDDDVLVLRNAGPKGAPGMPEAGITMPMPIPRGRPAGAGSYTSPSASDGFPSRETVLVRDGMPRGEALSTAAAGITRFAHRVHYAASPAASTPRVQIASGAPGHEPLRFRDATPRRRTPTGSRQGVRRDDRTAA